MKWFVISFKKEVNDYDQFEVKKEVNDYDQFEVKKMAEDPKPPFG